MKNPDISQITAEIFTICKQKQIVITTAESCTAGGVAFALSNIAGASECFYGGVVAYSNILKSHLLKVNESTIKNYGAVSKQTAIEMADGAYLTLKHLLLNENKPKIEPSKKIASLAITGIAGPSGGSATKPVGLVHFACKVPIAKVPKLLGSQTEPPKASKTLQGEIQGAMQGEIQAEIKHTSKIFGGNRISIQNEACYFALNFLKENLEQIPH